MALTDINVSSGDNEICQEEVRGNSGVLTDVCLDNETAAVMAIPTPSGGGGEQNYAFIG